MNEWRNAKVDANFRKAFELATDIAWNFDDEKIRSAYVIFAALNLPDSVISRLISDMDIFLVPNIELILEDKSLFANIFGEEAAERVFKEREELEKLASGNAKEEQSEENGSEAENLAEAIFDVLAEMLGYGAGDAEQLEVMQANYSDKLEQACDEAYYRCKAMNMDYIAFDVLVYTILQHKETSAYRFMQGILNGLGVEPDDFLNAIRISANISTAAEDVIKPIVIPSALETCVEVLNTKYNKGDELTILGRDKEIYKAFTIFSKKTKRNAVLVGAPGVGKTAIIEAITQKIVNETCPKEFFGYTVLSLDVNAMVAGTKYRGEFETKVAILKKFLEGTPKVILFVDEMHQMLGAGSTSDGNVDLSGSLKPILSRDDVVFVGATTVNEYNSILTRDGAFKRRFEVITVREPKNHEVKAMIEGKIKSMEKHHGVKMPRELLDYIILCSNCFNMENANPDKTLDLCDRSMAIAKMENRRTVIKACITKVYEEYFEKYSKIELGDIRATAYHEVGHYIVNRLTKQHKALRTVAISIVPAADYLGVNILEDTETPVPHDKEYIESYLMSLLAGRVAQCRATKSFDSGASNDLMVAKDFAKRVVMAYGMDQAEFQNISLVEEEKLITEKIANAVNEKVSALIKDAYKKTEAFIDAHWYEVDKMAKYLMKKKIVTSDELDKFLEE